tara:strand:+ start:564 stop:761 length:198 start_codon:yes stop_codon:yes gene_type:complete
MINELLDDARFSEDGKKRLLTHWLNNNLNFAEKEEVTELKDKLELREGEFYAEVRKRLETETTNK